MNKQPLYIIRFLDMPGYYSRDVRWEGATLERATRLTHKEARLVCDKFNSRKYNIPCIMEPAT